MESCELVRNQGFDIYQAKRENIEMEVEKYEERNWYTVLVRADYKHKLLILQGHPSIQEFRAASCCCLLERWEGALWSNQL